MRKISKAFALFLTLIIAMSSLTLLIVKHTNAQSIPTPSTPQFTIKFVNASYTSTTTNAYTGQSQTQLINNDSIEITIKNQPFDYSNNGISSQVFFNVRARPHFSGNWTEIYPIQTRPSSYNGDDTFSYADYINPDSPPQSKLTYTVIVFRVVPTHVYSESGDYLGYNIQRYYSGSDSQEGMYSEFLDAIPDGGQLDFQVDALVGHDSQRWVVEHPMYPAVGGHFAPATAYDSASGWSNSQSITIGETASISPTPTPTVPELSWLVIVPLLLSLLCVAAVRRHQRSSSVKEIADF